MTFEVYEALVSKLKETDIPFAEECWVHAPEGSYGVVSLAGAARVQYADDVMVNQAMPGNVDIYTIGQGLAEASAVEDVLNSVDGIGWNMTVRQYMPDLNMMHYTWAFSCSVM